MQQRPAQQRQRPQDISRMIDYVLGGAEIGAVVEPGRIFMAGHSLGGFTAVALAGGRYDADAFDGFCVAHPGELVCGIFDGWDVGKTPADRAAMQRIWQTPALQALPCLIWAGRRVFLWQALGRLRALKRFDLNLNHITLPEIKDFNALCDASWVKLKSKRYMLVIGAPDTIHGLDLDIESRALVAALPKGTTTYLEPAGLAHFDFLGVCTAAGLEILKEEEPEDAFVCEMGREERMLNHAAIADAVEAFFGGL